MKSKCCGKEARICLIDRAEYVSVCGKCNEPCETVEESQPWEARLRAIFADPEYAWVVNPILILNETKDFIITLLAEQEAKHKAEMEKLINKIPNMRPKIRFGTNEKIRDLKPIKKKLRDKYLKDK